MPNDGLIRYLAMFNEERILLTSPKALAEVLVTKAYDFRKPGMVRHTIGRVLGVGVLLAEGDEHRVQRRNLMPAFAFRHVKDLYPVFWDKAREGVQAMTEQILADAGKEPSSSSQTTTTTEGVSSSSSGGGKTAVLEVGAWASRITLDIIGVAGLGRDFGATADPANALFRAYNDVFQPRPQARLLTTLGLVLPARLAALLPVRRNGDIRAAAGLIRGVCRDLVREAEGRARRGEPAGADILSVALGSGAFAGDNLVDQLMTFLAAGHETTASSMTWAVYLLARHPGVQTRLRREVRERLPPLSGGESVSSLDIDGRMPYLSAVCAEVLRCFPPVPVTLREAAVDTTVLGRRVPRGTRVVASPAATNRDPLLWGPEAALFDPDRWLSRQQRQQQQHEGDEEGHGFAAAGGGGGGGGASSNYAFLTFLHGPRSCIGMGFARAEFACLLAAWVGRMAFELRDEEELDERNVEIKRGVTQRPAKGLWVKATVLDGW